MRVNSTFSGLFVWRFIVRSGVTIMILFCISEVYATERGPETETPLRHDRSVSGSRIGVRDVRAKQVNLIIREIGHRLLLQAGDSTSRVMPVTETSEGRFLLQFENQFDFSHDSLMVMSQALLPKTQFPSGYTVTVHDCDRIDIIYGFQFNNTSADLLPCRGRSEPFGCYIIEFDFPDFYADVEEDKAEVDQQQVEEVKPIKVVREEVRLKPEQPKTIIVDHKIPEMTKELKAAKVNPQEIDSNLNGPKAKTATFDYPLVGLAYGGVLVLLGVALLLGRLGKISTPFAMQNPDHAVIKETTSELPELGKFLFDVRNQSLFLGGEIVSLTDKECKILELLNESFGDLILRETLMQKVWIDEGVITGRSLDMFVSKLRKKLSGDSELRITNVHGKGYKLETVSA
jgi:hypothetical protein